VSDTDRAAFMKAVERLLQAGKNNDEGETERLLQWCYDACQADPSLKPLFIDMVRERDPRRDAVHGSGDPARSPISHFRRPWLDGPGYSILASVGKLADMPVQNG